MKIHSVLREIFASIDLFGTFEATVHFEVN